ncbi:MAG TPA: MFS transporter [Ideonella sp.]|uniref:MFS transporter n=1 Tax=Ideonella sp. TaxID=1929293 RepID=UPI002E3500B3|nr:MFS transporter [Ideonella sp.]HEX5683232.1 MFS transporter [Ideonella sp.]
MPPAPAPAPTDPKIAFRRVLGAEAVSNLGSMLSRLAIPWFATLALDATPWQMGWLLVADVAAGAAGALWLGGWVDRQPARRVMLLTDGLRALLLLTLAGLAAAGWLSWWMLALAAGLSGLWSVGFELARSAWLARASASQTLAERNAALSATGSVVEAVAFGIGGWLYQGLGAVAALALDGLSYLASALCLRGVPEARPAAGEPEAHPPAASLWPDVRTGFTTLWQHPALRSLAGIEALTALAVSVTGTSYMIYVSRDLGLALGPLGMVFALGGLGSLAGAALAPALGRRWGPGRAMTLGLAAMAVGACFIPLASGAGWGALVLLALHQLVGDAGHTLRNVHDATWRQTAAPPDRLARVDGSLRSIGHAVTLAGALGGGAAATAWGARTALAVSAGLLGLAALASFTWLARRRSAPVPA